MKKTVFYIPFLILFAFYSCENEPIDNALLNNNNNGGGGENPSLTCQEAIQATADASSALATATSETYTTLCNNLAAALQVQINTCGDTGGVLQATLDAMDCGSSSNDDCTNATLAVQVAESAYANASTDNYSELCNAYAAALQAQITACGDSDGSIQAIIDGLDCSNSEAVLFLHQKILTYLDGGVDTETYTYDGDKLISLSYSDGYNLEYIYNGDLLTTINSYDSTGALEYYLTTVYNSSNQLESYTVFITEGNEGIRVEHTYNTDGTISVQEFLGDHDSQNDLISESIITMNSDQILVEDYGADVETTYTYDSNNGMFKNISNLNTLNLISIDFSGYIDGGLNNVLSISENDGNGSIVVYDEFGYTYNSDNYPETSNYSYEGVQEGNIEYTYY